MVTAGTKSFSAPLVPFPSILGPSSSSVSEYYESTKEQLCFHGIHSINHRLEYLPFEYFIWNDIWLPEKNDSPPKRQVVCWCRGTAPPEAEGWALCFLWSATPPGCPQDIQPSPISPLPLEIPVPKHTFNMYGNLLEGLFKHGLLGSSPKVSDFNF